MNNIELEQWIHDRIVLYFFMDTLRVSKDVIGDKTFCTVQIFRDDVEIGGLRFDMARLERAPDQLEAELLRESQELAQKINFPL